MDELSYPFDVAVRKGEERRALRRALVIATEALEHLAEQDTRECSCWHDASEAIDAIKKEVPDA